MIVNFLCPSSREPVGGVIALYEFANGLVRRGHDVTLTHLRLWGRGIDRVEDLDRFRFEPSLRHVIPTGPHDLPVADLVFGTGAPPEYGLPVLLVQGMEILHPWLERSGFRAPCLKVCVASWLADIGMHYGMPADQFRLAPCGIDHDHFRVTTPIAERPRRVSMLYHHLPAKGWDVALAAVTEVRERFPDLEVTAFGASHPDGLPDWLDFHHDPHPDELVENIYNRSQVFVQASNYEGFGLTAVEAMACGASLVSTDNGGSRDYALHERTALVSPPGDVRGLADQIVALLSDDQRRTALAEAGRRHALRFDWDRSAELMEHHLEEYLAEPAAFQREAGPEEPLELLPPPASLTATRLSRSLLDIDVSGVL